MQPAPRRTADGGRHRGERRTRQADAGVTRLLRRSVPFQVWIAPVKIGFESAAGAAQALLRHVVRLVVDPRIVRTALGWTIWMYHSPR